MKSRYCTSSRIRGSTCCKLSGACGQQLQIAADKAVFLHSHVQRGGAGFIDRRRAVFLGQGENTQDAAHTDLALCTMDGIAEHTNVLSGAARSPQQLGSAQGRSLGLSLFLNAIL